MVSRTFQPTPAFRKKEEQVRQSILLETKEKLRNDMQKLFKDPQYCDLVLVSESNELLVHSFIVEARLPQFYKHLQSQAESNKVNIAGLLFPELERWVATLYSDDTIDRAFIEEALSLKKGNNPKQPSREENSLSADLLSLFNRPSTGDVEFAVGGNVVRAHKAILTTRSDYFAAMFSSSWKEASLSSITIPEVSYEIFLAVLKYIYGASQDILSFPASKVLQFSDMYGMQDLADLIADDLKVTKCHLFHKPCTYCIPQVYECLKLCETFYQTEKLRLPCIQWISKNFQKTLACRQFSQMSEHFQNDVRHEMKKHMSSSTSTVGVIWLKYNTLIASLKNLNTSWTQAVVDFVESVRELCLKDAMENFPVIIDLRTFGDFLRETNHSSSLLEQFLNEILERLTVSNCCYAFQGFQKIIDRVMAMDENESHFCSPFGSESFDVVQKCHKQCEKFIIGRIGPVSQTKAWQDISPSKQQELKSSACFVDLNQL